MKTPVLTGVVVDINDHRSHATIGGVAGSMVSGTVYITEVIAARDFDGIGSAMSFMTFVLVTIVVLFVMGMMEYGASVDWPAG